MTTRMRTTVRLLVASCLSSSAAAGLQSGVGAASYAGGMSVDADRGLVYLTGSVHSTGSGGCFASVVKVESDGLGWITGPQRMGSADTSANAACSSLIQSPVSDTGLYLIGGTEEGGLFTSELRTAGQPKRTQYGLVVEANLDSTTGKASTPGGYLIRDEPVQYPVAVVADDALSNYIYVASLFSGSTQENAGATSNKNPNFTSGGIRKYGKDYGMILERLRIKDLDASPTNADGTVVPTLGVTWRRPFASPLSPSVDASIYPTGLISVPDSLIVVGYTRGTGPVVGGGDDMDGDLDVFVAKLDPTSGSVQSSRRIDSEELHDDRALGACSDGTGTSFYVVGATAGALQDGAVANDGTDAAFVSKLNTATLETEWTVQIATSSAKPTNALGLGCAVDGDFVYLAGIVENGSTVQGGPAMSHGGDDVFVAQIMSKDGTRGWTQTVGTAGEDRLAHGGGVAVEPKSGDVLVYGDTTGAMYRRADDGGSARIFVARLDKSDGGYRTTVQEGGDAGPDDTKLGGDVGGDIGDNGDITGGDDTGGDDSGGDTGGDDTGGDDTGGDTGGDDTGADDTGGDTGGDGTGGDDTGGDTGGDDTGDNGTVEDTIRDQDSGDNIMVTPRVPEDNSVHRTRRATLLFIGAGIVLAGIAAFLLVARSQQEKEISTERAQVFAYLQNFDVEDVDLRHSATGGWHGTYVNKLAQGYNRSDPLGPNGGSSHNGGAPDTLDTLESAPLTHSSIAKDSLFLDVDSRPSLGGDAASTISSDSSGGGSVSRGYDGLVGAYNDTYGSQKPRSSKRNSKNWGSDII